MLPAFIIGSSCAAVAILLMVVLKFMNKAKQEQPRRADSACPGELLDDNKK
jgi:hypothetical protein